MTGNFEQQEGSADADADLPAHSSQGDDKAPNREWAIRARVLPVVGLGLVAYVFTSSVLGVVPLLIVAIFPSTGAGPVAIYLAMWSASVAADVVFVVGSITTAVVSVFVAKRSTMGAAALASAMTAATYMVGFSFTITSAIGMPGEGGPPAPGEPNNNGIAILISPLIGIFGLGFAAATASIAPRLLGRLRLSSGGSRQDD